MRLLITGDWHLGKIVNNYALLTEQAELLDQVMQHAINENIDALIITGDIYDRAIPPKEAVNLFNDFLSTLILTHHKKVLMISGNHDSLDRMAFGSSLLEKAGLFIAPRFDKTVYAVTLEDAFGPVNFYMIPYTPYQEVRYALQDDSIQTFHQAYEKMFATTQVDTSKRNVFITHAFAVSNVVKVETSDSEKTLAMGGIECVDVKLFAPFDYVALGHIHKPQRIEKDHYRYAGSLYKYSFSEANHQKSMILLDLMEKGHIEQSLISLKATKDFVVLTDTFEALMHNPTLQEKHKNDYVKIVLLDEQEVINPVGKLKAFFPFLMEFKYQNPKVFTYKDASMSEALQQALYHKTEASFEENVVIMFEDFADKTAGIVLNESQKGLLVKLTNQVLKEDQSL